MSELPPEAGAVIIDDDPDVRLLLSDILTGAGFVTFPTESGAAGIAAVREHDPIITTVDLDMPGIDGFETVRRIREISDAYVVLITAATDEASAVLAFGIGADDVIVKPFRARELRARLIALTRRSRGTPATTAPPSAPVPATGLSIDTAARTVRVDGAEVALTRTEFELLAAVMHSGRRVHSRTDLVLALYGDVYSSPHAVSPADERAIEAHITNLRRKLGDQASHPRFIETVRGVGYRAVSASALPAR